MSGARARVSLWILIFLSCVTSILPISSAYAADVTARSLTLGSSAASASTTYSFSFKAVSATAVKSVDFQACTTAQGTCTALTSGFATGSALTGQPTNLGAASGWTVDNTSGHLRLKNASNATAQSTTLNATISFSGVTNINTDNTSFYFRITTYSDATYTTVIDGPSTVAASTAKPIVLSGTMPESLVFCTGGTVPNIGGVSTNAPNCSAATTGVISFNPQLFSTQTTSTATSQMAASTNAGSGYAITYTGDTMKNGSGNPIAAMATATTSSISTSQFGLNLAANTQAQVPGAAADFGSALYTPTTGVAGNVFFGAVDTSPTNYTTNGLFSYIVNTPTEVAKSTQGTDLQTYTVSYIVNVPGSQAAGTYTTTITYICTATY
jgi:hypothetical protein